MTFINLPCDRDALIKIVSGNMGLCHLSNEDIGAVADFVLSRIEADAGVRGEQDVQPVGLHISDEQIARHMLEQVRIRMDHRLNVILERDGAEKAITGPGIGISYMFASEIHRACKRALDVINRLSRQPAAEAGAWRPMESAPRDGTEIIYWNTTSSAKGEGFVSSCIWRDADEGVQEGWWDDSCTENVEPAGWLQPLPDPPPADAALTSEAAMDELAKLSQELGLYDPLYQAPPAGAGGENPL